MSEFGYGISPDNQLRCGRLWRNLDHMRKAAVDCLLLYRTKEFDNFCARWPQDDASGLVREVRRWECKYRSEILQLEFRVGKASRGETSGASWLCHDVAAERLDIPNPTTSWNSARNRWFSDAEEADFKSTPQSASGSTAELGCSVDVNAVLRSQRDKSLFVSFLHSGKYSLSVIPIITIKKGDSLGVFAGHIRYSETFDAIHGIRGPRARLWLDYSQVTGVLNTMRVTPPGGDANVRLHWELHHEELQPEWRVSVRALRTIQPFEEIIRSADQDSQYQLHQDAASARRGFLRTGHSKRN